MPDKAYLVKSVTPGVGPTILIQRLARTSADMFAEHMQKLDATQPSSMETEEAPGTNHEAVD